ncbi:MAG: DegT/DnrJ/EryC1/StrS family aminotransferase [Pseudomonadota bacterium]
MERCDFVLGQAVGEFEKRFADYCGVSHAVGVASGTDALHLAFRALDVGPGDEVILPAMTFVATALGVVLAGATPVLADVRDADGLLDLDKAAAAVTDKTRAVCPVHLFGQCMESGPLLDFARERGLLLVEDAAQAHGAYDGKVRAGSFGHAACFSFYPGKNLGAYGDGGAVCTPDPETDRRLRMLRNYGSPKKYLHEEFGTNSRLDTLQAAVLNVKLARLDAWNRRRAELAALYDQALANIPGVTLTAFRPDSVYHLYVIRVPNRDRVLAALNEAGIGAGIHYPYTVHEAGMFSHLFAGQEFPVAEDWARRSISLPLYAEMPEQAVERAARVLKKTL